jgi:uncharacterized membrane protein YuzA (DUF378 family)
MSEMHKIHVFDVLALALLIAGGVNWLLVGLFDWNLVSAIFTPLSTGATRLVYVLVGLAAIYSLIRIPAMAHYRIEPAERPVPTP